MLSETAIFWCKFQFSPAPDTVDIIQGIREGKISIERAIELCLIAYGDIPKFKETEQNIRENMPEAVKAVAGIIGMM